MVRYQVTFHSPLSSSAARASVVSWLQAIGYGLASAPFLSSIEASRGSILGNAGSLNPKQWSARVLATFTPANAASSEEGCQIVMEWRVVTVGQIVTKADIAFWSYEVSQTLAVSMGARPDPAAWTMETKKAQKGNIWRALLFTGALLGPLIAVSAVTGSLIAGSVAMALLGTACWYALRAPRVLQVTTPVRHGPPSPAPPPLR